MQVLGQLLKLLLLPRVLHARSQPLLPLREQTLEASMVVHGGEQKRKAKRQRERERERETKTLYLLSPLLVVLPELLKFAARRTQHQEKGEGERGGKKKEHYT